MAWQSGNQNVISQLVKGASEFAKLFRAICQTMKEDHRAFRALSMGQENRKAKWVELRPFGALHLVKTAQQRSEMTKNAKSRANPSRTSLTTTFLDFLGGSFIKDRSLVSATTKS